jgi:hypothetical protein
VDIASQPGSAMTAPPAASTSMNERRFIALYSKSVIDGATL